MTRSPRPSAAVGFLLQHRLADLVLDTTAMTAAQAASRVGEPWRAAAH